MSAPSAPRIQVRPWPSDQNITFYWEPPASDGGSPVLYYTLTEDSIPLTEYVSTNLATYTVSSLTNATDYTFTMTATNTNGTGPAATFRSVQPGRIPFGPTTAALSTFNISTALVTWDLSTIAGEGDSKWFVLTTMPSSLGMAHTTKSAYIYERARTFQLPSTNVYYKFLVRSANDVGYCNPFAYTTLVGFGITDFYPDQVAGLELWLDAADAGTYTLSGSTLTAWNDKSQLGKAVAIPSGVVVNPADLNNSNTFTTSNTLSTAGLSAAISTGQFSLFGVWKAPTNTLMSFLRLGSTSNYVDLFYSPSVPGKGHGLTTLASNGATSTIDVHNQPEGYYRLQTGYRTPANLEVVTLNVASSSITDNVELGGNSFIRIGGTGAQIAEVVVYRGDIGDSNRSNVSNYLNDKWFGFKTNFNNGNDIGLTGFDGGKLSSNTPTGTGFSYDTTSNTTMYKAVESYAAAEMTWCASIYQSTGRAYAGILMSRQNASGLIMNGESTCVSYMWNGTGFDTDTQLFLSTNTWTHVACVVTPSNALWYRNGTLFYTLTTVHTATDLGTVYVGVDPQAFATKNLIGLVDNIRVHRRALSAAEISTIYARTLTG